MAFDPNNPVVQLCLEGMSREDGGDRVEAGRIYQRAWSMAGQDFERFLAAYFFARVQTVEAEKLKWLRTTLEIGLGIDDDSVRSAFPALHAAIARSYEAIGDLAQAEKHRATAATLKYLPSDPGPFYHGTKADLQVGDLLTAGGKSNYQQELRMNHIYFTALVNGAGLAAALAQGAARERVYLVEPTGPFENDPNVTDKKIPGNPTRSYRSEAPLKIIGEVADWVRITPEELRRWREKLAGGKGVIIN